MLSTYVQPTPLFWMIFLLLRLLPTSAESSPGSIDKTIIILAGQSNMAGRGGVINNVWDRIIPPTSNPKSTLLRLDPNLRWHEAKEPLHKGIDINHTCGVGPGLAFANSVINRAPRLGVIGLVPCAVGGTNISQWSRKSHLYSQLVRRAAYSVRDGGSIQAFVWYQGESDTILKVDADKYQERVQKLFSDFRSDLQSPLLPIIQVAIASGEGPYVEEVREAQMGVNLMNLKTIDAKGLPLEPDNLHLTTTAQVKLGEKLADAFLHFLPTHLQTSPNDMLLQTNAANILYIFWSYNFLLVFVLILLQKPA